MPQKRVILHMNEVGSQPCDYKSTVLQAKQRLQVPRPQDREDLVCARNSKEANVLSKGRMPHSEFKDVASIQIMLSLVGQNLKKIN